MVSSYSHIKSDREILKVSNLVAGYRRDLPIVMDVSMDVYKGEILTLLGPNGAGKSTLIKGICGLVEVISGNVVFQGAEISNLETHEIIERRVAYVPQTQNVHGKGQPLFDSSKGINFDDPINSSKMPVVYGDGMSVIDLSRSRIGL